MSRLRKILQYTFSLTKARENSIKQKLESLKPANISSEEREKYREELEGILKQIEKKVASLSDKSNNKKRAANLEYFKEHQAKLSLFIDWLQAPSRKFPADIMN